MEEQIAKESKYLTKDQIEAIRQQLDSLGESPDALLKLVMSIDSYIRVNEKADAEYEAIYTIIETLDLMGSNQLNYEVVVRSTIPMLTALTFYDYLLITGIIAPEELAKVKGNLGADTIAKA